MNAAVDTLKQENQLTDAEKYRADAKRWKQWFESAMVMIDSVPAKVVWLNADEQFKITYVNTEGRKALTKLAKPLGIEGADKVFGQTGDFFFQAGKSALPDVSNSARLPHRERLQIGDEIIDVAIHPVTDNKGVYCGALMTWREATKRIRIAERFENQVLSIVNGIRNTASELESSSEKLNSIAEQSTSRTELVSDSNNKVQHGLSESQNFVNEVISAVNELEATRGQSDQLLKRISDQASLSEQRIQSLEEGTSEIGLVANLIMEIAHQTNLLALNATIEAARAGDAGRGFAVVAQEIKALADKTTEATKKIGDRIENIQTATENAVSAMGEIAKSVQDFDELQPVIMSAVDNHSAAVESMSSSIRAASQHAEQATLVNAELRSAAADVGGASTDIHDEIMDLGRSAENLQSEAMGLLGFIK